MTSLEDYRRDMDRGGGAVETVTERLERELFFTRKLHASLCRQLKEDARGETELIEVYARQIDDLRIALGALYSRIVS